MGVLYDNIKKEGIKQPVAIWLGKWTPRGEETRWSQEIQNGHHRIAIANDINPEMYIPVRYIK